MITTIARKEWTEIVRDGRFRWIGATVLALLAVALVTGWQDASAARKAFSAAREAEAATWLGQGEKNPHSAAHFGQYAFKPTPPLAWVDRGVNDYLGTTVWLEAHSQNPFQMRPAEDATALSRFSSLTASWTLQLLVPLLIVLLAFNAFAGERERGTLRQLLSLGLRPTDLALGKALGIAAALGMVLVPAVALGAAVLVLGFAGQDAVETLSRALVLAGGYLVYFAAFLGISLSVSAWTRSARSALLVLLGFWIVSCLLVPRLSADVAEHLYPTPTQHAFYEAVAEDEERGLGGHGSRGERREALESKLLAEYGVASLDELPVNFAGISLQASEEHSNLVFDKHFGRLWETYRRQEGVHRLAALASPLLAVRTLSMGVAGTDVEQHRHFAAAAEVHRRTLVEELNHDMTENAGNSDFGYLADASLWSEAPAFEYRLPGLGWVLQRQLISLGLLALWAVLAAFAAVRQASRLQPI